MEAARSVIGKCTRREWLDTHQAHDSTRLRVWLGSRYLARICVHSRAITMAKAFFLSLPLDHQAGRPLSSDPKLPRRRRRRCDGTIAKSLCDHSKCTELTLEQHDFDECPTPQTAGRLNVGYFQVEKRPVVL